jgi:hypothetical protein
MKYSIYVTLFCLILLIAGCSSNKEKVEPTKYSDDTNRAFEMIERGYLKKSSPKVAPPQISSQQVAIRKPMPVQPTAIIENKREVEVLRPGQQHGVQEEILINEKINYQADEKPSELSNLPQMMKEKSSNKADERLIEINQNLAYYCMKHRKDPTFGGDELKCTNFVKKSMKQCQKNHHIVNSQLLNCIQAKLKKRR